MNLQQVIGSIRQVTPFVGGFLAGIGVMQADEFTHGVGLVLDAVGATMLAGSWVWSLVDKTKANLISTVATLKGDDGKKLVQTIEMASTREGAALAHPSVTPSNVVVAPPTFGTAGQR